MYSIDYTSPCFTADEFARILELCFLNCDYFTITIYNSLGTNDTAQKLLNPYLHKEISTTHWFRYYVTENNPLKVMVYPICYKTISLLKKFYKNIFYCGNSKANNQNIEDLCFFKNGKLVLGSVYHESICQVYPPDDSFAKCLCEIYDNWQYSNDDCEQITL